MSHSVIRSITIKNNQVIVTSACSNVSPKHYISGEAPSLTETLVNQGKKALDSIILKEFREGNFRGVGTVYGKAIVWQSIKKREGIEIPDDELLARFKEAWSAKKPVNASYLGYLISSIGKRTFMYGPCEGKVFQNKDRAQYALRDFSHDKIDFCLVA